MTLQQLHYALTLQKYTSFHEAALHLKISQPVLSLQIGKLESELSLVLFDRSKKPVNPTSEWREFLYRANAVVHGANNLADFTMNMSVPLKGRLKMGITPSLAPFLVSFFAYSFQYAYSEIALGINEMLTKQIPGIENQWLNDPLPLVRHFYELTPVTVLSDHGHPVF